ncbi:lysozyme [Hyphomicrobium sp.]|uniref:lysozyme n=1 Tax=Hyphomicrobium sp. TaxID=82 RepID=UPI002E312B01|nr:glycoside hydrolase family protein [Hyphomicrobium sp.]HEX2841794.1 glycoside hydrolase family protein [Hyphomicrobium sp.]
MHSFYLDAIRNFEGFTPKAQWDYAQHTNGYGTKARFAGEVVDRVEAERRFQSEISAARSIVEKAAPELDDGTKAALTSLTYNAGSAWVKSGLGDAARSGDLESVREIFQKYNKAGGEVLPGLVSRRSQEALWIGNPDALSGTGSSASVSPNTLPPVVMDQNQSAAQVAEMLRTPAPAETRTASPSESVVIERGPRAERSAALKGLLDSVASDALAALANSDLVGPGGVGDIARMAQLDRGSTLAKADGGRVDREKETRRI